MKSSEDGQILRKNFWLTKLEFFGMGLEEIIDLHHWLLETELLMN